MKPSERLRQRHRPHPRGVFLHTGWRTAGTWVWSRFRTLRRVRAYYEPFHEMLASDRARLESARADGWESGHPAMRQAYFDEYLPLLVNDRGAQHFDTAFEMDRFSALDTESSTRLKVYLESLLSAAQRDHKIAVMKFCRSMGRMRWMIDAFPDVAHVVVVRNPAAQWASAWQQLTKHGNPWFMAAPYRVLAANLDNDRVRRVIQALECDFAVEADATIETGYTELVKNQAPERSYRAFLALWVLNTLTITPAVAAIVDSDLLGLSHQYGVRCARQLGQRLGLSLNFNDAHPLPVSSTPRHAHDWLGFDAEAALHWHAAADRFAQAEIGADRSEALALAVLRSKIAMANQQAWLGGLAWQPAREQIAEPIRYCTDLLAFQSSVVDTRPNEQLDGQPRGAARRNPLVNAWGATVDTLRSLATKSAKKPG